MEASRMDPNQAIADLKRLVGPMPAWSPTEADPHSEMQKVRWMKWSCQNELIGAYARMMKDSEAAAKKDAKKSRSVSSDPIRSRDYLGSPLRPARS